MKTIKLQINFRYDPGQQHSYCAYTTLNEKVILAVSDVDYATAERELVSKLDKIAQSYKIPIPSPKTVDLVIP